MTEQIDTYIAGVRFNNRDGTSRQAILERLQGDEPLTLVWEPNNPHSESGNATAVYSPLGQIGYLPGKIVAGIVEKYENGPKVAIDVAFTEQPRGIGFSTRSFSTDDGDFYGADITLTITPAG